MRNPGKTRLNSCICDQNSKLCTFQSKYSTFFMRFPISYLVPLETFREGEKDDVTISSVKL